MVDTKAKLTRVRQFAKLAVAVAAGLIVVVLIFWWRDWHGTQRFSDINWWARVSSHLIGYLFIGKAGFHLALAGIATISGIVVWARHRRQTPSSGDGDD